MLVLFPAEDFSIKEVAGRNHDGQKPRETERKTKRQSALQNATEETVTKQRSREDTPSTHAVKVAYSFPLTVQKRHERQERMTEKKEFFHTLARKAQREEKPSE